MSTLILSDIGKCYGNTVALTDVSLQVDSGEFICLLGESGCGKTTLLRIIAGLVDHDQGQIQLDGRDLSGVPCHKRNIGMVFQSLALFPHLNAGKNIAYGLRMKGASTTEMNNRVDQLLTMVGLDDFASRSVASLSGGQKQRVAIARALALEPDLFLMDEPFSALDAGLRDHLQLEVRKLQQQLGITTIFVTHDQREAMALADRIVVLNKGAIEQAGTPEEIYQRPATRFVAEFIGANNLLDINVDENGIWFDKRNLGQAQSGLQDHSGPATIAIRPEAISLQSINHLPADEQGLQGKVLMQRPVGALIEYEIDVGKTIIKQTCFQSAAPAVSVGDNVNLEFDWTQAWLLK